MQLRRRPSTATGLALGGLLAIALGAVLWLLSESSEARRTAVEPAPSHRVAGAASSVYADRAPRVPVSLGAEGEVPADLRSMRAPGSGDPTEPDSGGSALEAGELEVLVRVNAGLADGWVSLQRIETNDLATPFEPSRTIEAPLEKGVARFSDLPQGVLLVGVLVGPGPPLRSSWVNSRVRGARLEFELGSARIFGWVRDADGAAAEGAQVKVTGRQGTVVASSAADGSYDVGGILPAGRYTVQVAGHPVATTFPKRIVDLADASRLDVSFGPGGGLSHWTGRLLAPDGQPITKADALPNRGVRLVAEGGRGAVLDVHVVDGVIDQWFERGVYDLRRGSDRVPPLARPDRHATSSNALERIDLSRDLARDVQLDGFVLIGKVDVPQEESGVVSLHKEGEFDKTHAAIGADGSFRFVGLEPGTYALRWAAGDLGSLTIDPFGPIVREVDLTQMLARPR